MASRSRRGSAASEHAGETNKGGDAQHVCVAVRVRPLNANELRANASTVVGVAGSSITLVDPISLEYTGVGAAAIAQHSALPRAGAMVAPAFHAGMDVPRRTFTFNHVFHRASQQNVFEALGSRVLEQAWAGLNTSVFAYGQTGSGKSYTMLGSGGGGAATNTSVASNASAVSASVLDPATSDPGLIPRICRSLFSRIAQEEQAQAAAIAAQLDAQGSDPSSGNVVTTRQSFSVTANYLEIYCERVRDLLAVDSVAGLAALGNGTSSGSGGGGGGQAGKGRRRSISSAANVNSSWSALSSIAGSGASVLGNGGAGHGSGGGGRDLAAERDAAAAAWNAAAAGGNLRVREHPTRGAFVEGLREVPVRSFGEVEKLLVAGSFVRTIAETRMNEASSRSHAIFTLTFVQRTVDVATGTPLNEKSSKIVLTDLAGSERADTLLPRGGGIGGSGKASSAEAAAVEAVRQREMSKINTSLSALGAVIKALASRSSAIAAPSSSGNAASSNFVPYRNSVLTWLLKDSLGGNSTTVMLAAVSPADSSYSETLSTLKYCESVKRIVQTARVNEGLSADNTAKIINELRAEVGMLRAALAEEQRRASLAPPQALSDAAAEAAAVEAAQRTAGVLAAVTPFAARNSRTGRLGGSSDADAAASGGNEVAAVRVARILESDTAGAPGNSPHHIYAAAEDAMAKSGLHVTLTAEEDEHITGGALVPSARDPWSALKTPAPLHGMRGARGAVALTTPSQPVELQASYVSGGWSEGSHHGSRSSSAQTAAVDVDDIRSPHSGTTVPSNQDGHFNGFASTVGFGFSSPRPVSAATPRPGVGASGFMSPKAALQMQVTRLQAELQHREKLIAALQHSTRKGGRVAATGAGVGGGSSGTLDVDTGASPILEPVTSPRLRPARSSSSSSSSSAEMQAAEPVARPLALSPSSPAPAPTTVVAASTSAAPSPRAVSEQLIHRADTELVVAPVPSTGVGTATAVTVAPSSREAELAAAVERLQGQLREYQAQLELLQQQADQYQLENAEAMDRAAEAEAALTAAVHAVREDSRASLAAERRAREEAQAAAAAERATSAKRTEEAATIATAAVAAQQQLQSELVQAREALAAAEAKAAAVHNTPDHAENAAAVQAEVQARLNAEAEVAHLRSRLEEALSMVAVARQQAEAAAAELVAQGEVAAEASERAAYAEERAESAEARAESAAARAATNESRIRDAERRAETSERRCGEAEARAAAAAAAAADAERRARVAEERAEAAEAEVIMGLNENEAGALQDALAQARALHAEAFDRVRQLEAEVEDAHAAADAACSARDDLAEELRQLEDVAQQAAAEVGSLKQAVAAAEADAARARSSAEATTASRDSLKAKCTALQARLLQLQEEASYAQEAAITAQERADAAETEVQAARESAAAAAQSLDTALATARSEAARADRLAGEVASLHQRLSSSNTTADTSEQSTAALCAAQSSLREMTANWSADRSAWASQKAELEAALIAANARADRFQRQLLQWASHAQSTLQRTTAAAPAAAAVTAPAAESQGLVNSLAADGHDTEPSPSVPHFATASPTTVAVLEPVPTSEPAPHQQIDPVPAQIAPAPQNAGHRSRRAPPPPPPALPAGYALLTPAARKDLVHSSDAAVPAPTASTAPSSSTADQPHNSARSSRSVSSHRSATDRSSPAPVVTRSTVEALHGQMHHIAAAREAMTDEMRRALAQAGISAEVVEAVAAAAAADAEREAHGRADDAHLDQENRQPASVMVAASSNAASGASADPAKVAVAAVAAQPLPQVAPSNLVALRAHLARLEVAEAELRKRTAAADAAAQGLRIALLSPHSQDRTSPAAILSTPQPGGSAAQTGSAGGASGGSSGSGGIASGPRRSSHHAAEAVRRLALTPSE